MSAFTTNPDRLIAFVGVILGTIGLLASLARLVIDLWRLKERRRNERMDVSWYYDGPISLDTVPRWAAARINSLDDGEVMDDLFILEGRIENTGGVLVKEEDVQQPIEFNFNDSITLLDAEITDRYPANLEATLHPKSGSQAMRLHLPLLQPGEQVHLRFLCRGLPEPPDVSARIEGMPGSLTNVHISTLSKRIGRTLPVAGLVFGMILLLVSIPSVIQPTPYGPGFILGFVAAGAIGYILQQLRLQRNRMQQGNTARGLVFWVFVLIVVAFLIFLLVV